MLTLRLSSSCTTGGFLIATRKCQSKINDNWIMADNPSIKKSKNIFAAVILFMWIQHFQLFKFVLSAKQLSSEREQLHFTQNWLFELTSVFLTAFCSSLLYHELPSDRKHFSLGFFVNKTHLWEGVSIDETLPHRERARGAECRSFVSQFSQCTVRRQRTFYELTGQKFFLWAFSSMPCKMVMWRHGGETLSAVPVAAAHF